MNLFVLFSQILVISSSIENTEAIYISSEKYSLKSIQKAISNEHILKMKSKIEIFKKYILDSIIGTEHDDKKPEYKIWLNLKDKSVKKCYFCIFYYISMIYVAERDICFFEKETCNFLSDFFYDFKHYIMIDDDMQPLYYDNLLDALIDFKNKYIKKFFKYLNESMFLNDSKICSYLSKNFNYIDYDGKNVCFKDKNFDHIKILENFYFPAFNFENLNRISTMLKKILSEDYISTRENIDFYMDYHVDAVIFDFFNINIIKTPKNSDNFIKYLENILEYISRHEKNCLTLNYNKKLTINLFFIKTQREEIYEYYSYIFYYMSLIDIDNKKLENIFNLINDIELLITEKLYLLIFNLMIENLNIEVNFYKKNYNEYNFLDYMKSSKGIFIKKPIILWSDFPGIITDESLKTFEDGILNMNYNLPPDLQENIHSPIKNEEIFTDSDQYDISYDSSSSNSEVTSE